MSKEKDSPTNNLIKAFFNPRAWSSYDMMIEIFEYLRDAIARLFLPAPKKNYQKLEDVMIKFSLSEKDIQIRMKSFFRMGILLLIVSLLIFAYTLYYLLYQEYLVVIVGTVVTLLALSFAFRYHFWYFQLKKGKLGCTFKEWFREAILGEKHDD